MGIRERVTEILQGSFDSKVIRLNVSPTSGKLFGFMVASEFDNVPDRKRQQMVWSALAKRLKPEEQALVTSIMAFSPDEEELITDTPEGH